MWVQQYSHASEAPKTIMTSTKRRAAGILRSPVLAIKKNFGGVSCIFTAELVYGVPTEGSETGGVSARSERGHILYLKYFEAYGTIFFPASCCVQWARPSHTCLREPLRNETPRGRTFTDCVACCSGVLHVGHVALSRSDFLRNVPHNQPPPPGSPLAIVQQTPTHPYFIYSMNYYTSCKYLAHDTIWYERQRFRGAPATISLKFNLSIPSSVPFYEVWYSSSSTASVSWCVFTKIQTTFHIIHMISFNMHKRRGYQNSPMGENHRIKY